MLHSEAQNTFFERKRNVYFLQTHHNIVLYVDIGAIHMTIR